MGDVAGMVRTGWGVKYRTAGYKHAGCTVRCPFFSEFRECNLVPQLRSSYKNNFVQDPSF